MNHDHKITNPGIAQVNIGRSSKSKENNSKYKYNNNKKLENQHSKKFEEHSGASMTRKNESPNSPIIIDKVWKTRNMFDDDSVF